MRPGLALPIVGLVLLSAACFHATVDTGLAPSTTVVEKAWASGWIYGLVPPSTVETQSKCSSGVSKVETQLSFVNMLVAFLTLDIYTPMSIKVTCAQGGHAAVPSGATEIKVDRAASATDLEQALRAAAARAAASGQPVYVTAQ